MTRLLAALGLLLMATPVGAASIQGPVRGVVEVADGAQVDDIVVHLGCRTHGIHSSSWPADDVTRIVASGESFLIPWAYRGLSPAGCSLNVYHPRYVVARSPLDTQFSQQLGVIRLQSWGSFMREGPKPPPMPSHYPWPKTEFNDHLNNLLFHYIPAFSEGTRRKALGRHIPGLHALLKRVLPTGAFGPWPSKDRSLPIGMIRQIEEAVSYPGSQSGLFKAIADKDATRVRTLIEAGAFVDGWDDEGRTPLVLAVRNGFTEAAIALLDGGADINLPQGTDTAVKVAFSNSQWKTAAALLARGATPPKLDGTYPPVVNAICIVSAQGDTVSLHVFLDAGVSPNLAESSGFSPLMCAAKHNQLEAARVLIKAGADVNARATHDRTALGLSKAGRFDALVEVLKDAGARD